MTSARAKPARQQQGYVVMLMLIALVMGGLYGLISRLDAVTQRTQRIENTGQALQMAKEALIAYAATYPDTHNSTDAFGFLPCPDMDGNGIAGNSSNCGTTGITVIGLLPFKTLGLPDLRDSQGNCLWYAVSGSHKNVNPASLMNWDTQSMITVQTAQGAVLTQPGDAKGGAVAVIFAVGPPGNGQSRPAADSTKVCGYAPASTSYSNFVFSDVPANIGIFKDDTTTATVRSGTSELSQPGNTLAWVSPVDLFTRIKSRKGTTTSDFVGRMHNLGTQITASLSTVTTLPDPVVIFPNPAGTVGSIAYGSMPTIALTGQLATDFQNWRNQYIYAKCTSNSKCMNSGTCTGMLIFAGERTSGGPRNSYTVGDYLEEPNLSSLSAPGGTVFSNAYSTNANISPSYGVGSISQFAISNPNLAASRDDAICLNPALSPSFTISSVNGFQTTSTSPTASATINTNTSTLTLGSQIAINTSGCAWYPSPVTISSGMSAYFRFNIQDRGEGFTFTIADATSNPSPAMCGKSGAAMGYSGNTQTFAPIKPPKVGIEFDTRSSSARNDSNDHHAAIVLWAGSNSPDDDIDNQHNSCAQTAGTPCNSQRTTLNLLDNDNTGKVPPDGDVYVRVDVIPLSTSLPPTGYKINVYITGSTATKYSCELDHLDLNNKLNEVSDSCLTLTPRPTYLSYTLATTMSSAYLGFTTGQANVFGGDQSILVDRFMANSH